MSEHIGNRYLLQQTIGIGGMGTVYKAYDRLTRETVALKQVNAAPDTLRHNTRGQTGNEQVDLANEFRTLATLRHPHIISVLDYGFDTRQKPHFTMTFLENTQNFLDATRNQPLSEQVHLINQMLLALVYLHQRGIVHRDVKPANILVTNQQVKVLDFGLSVSAQVAKGRVGTLDYMAPETLAQGTTLPVSDLYSLGVILYRLFTDELPYQVDDIVSRISNPVSVEKLSGHPLALVVERLLELDPQDRYDSASDVIKAICKATDTPLPIETDAIRESFIQMAPFVGRDNEISQLEQALQDAVVEHSSVWLVGGESGVGKSRLVDELRIRALVNGVLVIQGQAVSEGGLPFELWRPIVRRLVLAADLTDLQASILKELVPDISDLLGRAVADAPRLTGRSYQERLALALEDVLSQQKTSTLLILEDLQWADESLLLLHHLLSVIHHLPQLVIVATYRDDERPQLPMDFPMARHLSLERLDEAAIAKLSAAMLGVAGEQRQIIELLQRETDGNTFFMVEVVRTLAEEAGTLADIGRITLPEHVFTGSMQRILQQRTEELPRKYQPILHFAAIAGRQINPLILQRAFSAAEIERWLYACHTLAIIMTQHNRWLFIHDKLREAILRDLSAEETRTLHQQVATAIEAAYPDDAAQDEVLLEHWHGAGNLDKEIFYLDRAVQRLIRITGEYAKAQSLLKRALMALPDADSRHILLLNYLAECHWEASQVDDAYTVALDAFTRAEAQNDLVGKAYSLSNMGDVMRVKGIYEQARQYYGDGLAIYEQLGDKEGVANSLHMLGNTYARMGRYVESREYYERGLKRHRELGQLRGIAANLEDLAVVLRVNLELEKALAYTEEALAISQQIGDQRGTALKLNSLGRALRDLERYPEAEDNLNQSLVMLEKLRDDFGTSWTRYNLGLVIYKRRDYEYAKRITQHALNGYEKLGDKYGIALCLNSLGFIDCAEANDDAAIEKFCRALTNAQAINVPPLGLYAFIGFAYIFERRGDMQRVRDLLHLAYAHPSINTEIYFRLNDLPPTLARIKAELRQTDTPTLDYDTTVKDLLAEFKA
jgi:tetratricopeptide (TPR) repeat protein